MTKLFLTGGEVMSDTINRVEVVINGEPYILKGPESPEYMEALASRLNERLARVQEMNPRLGLSRSAMLTALNILDEFMRLEREHRSLVDLLEEPKDRSKK